MGAHIKAATVAERGPRPSGLAGRRLWGSRRAVRGQSDVHGLPDCATLIAADSCALLLHAVRLGPKYRPLRLSSCPCFYPCCFSCLAAVAVTLHCSRASGDRVTPLELLTVAADPDSQCTVRNEFLGWFGRCFAPSAISRASLTRSNLEPAALTIPDEKFTRSNQFSVSFSLRFYILFLSVHVFFFSPPRLRAPAAHHPPGWW